jgi:hypothetical protein
VGGSNPQTPNGLATVYVFLAKVLEKKTHIRIALPIFIVNSSAMPQLKNLPPFFTLKI